MMVHSRYAGLIAQQARAHTRRRRRGCVAERESGTGMDDKLELLQRVPLFAGLDREGLEEIGRIAEEIEARAGTDLTHEGRHEGYFFVIVSGSVRIDRGGQTINTIGPGDFPGEIPLTD